jgi:DNA-binding transcriptional MerR regulator
MKVGELARRTGISVRTLHHYDDIGLLKPSQCSESNHRIYSQSDVARLQHIVSLKALGLSLTEISNFLAKPDSSPVSIIQLHLKELKSELVEREKLAARLERIESALKSKQQKPTVDELLNLIEAITMFEKYYSQNDLTRIFDRAKSLGTDQIRLYEKEWSDLIDLIRAEMKKGADPGSERVQECARQWMKLIESFTGGDASIARSLGSMYKEEGAAKASQGSLDKEVFRYMNEAIERLKTSTDTN